MFRRRARKFRRYVCRSHRPTVRATFRSLRFEPLETRWVLNAEFPEFVDPNPNPDNEFGHSVVALSTGNVVITSPFDDAGGTDAGAVYLFNGETGALISTLTGSTANDNVGLSGVTALTNGNYVVRSFSWDNGAATNAGAVTFGSGVSGVSGVVSAANSLVGSTANDGVGSTGVTALTNGNYVVRSSLWDNGAANNAGAVTWGNGSSGVKGVVSSANSLVGSTAGDAVGIDGVTALTNGNYVVLSSGWDNGAATDAGAVTWGNGSSGVTGAVSAANSLVGSTIFDRVGASLGQFAVTALSNGNYVVAVPLWDNGAATDAGAVTWGNGSSGVTGAVSAANSLVGSTANDGVGSTGVTALTNGNYVVGSSNWDNGAATNAGAVTFGSGTSGVSGVVSAANSLVGSTSNDNVGSGGVTALTNGNYVVRSQSWNNGAATDAGAVTFGSGTSGVSGIINTSNSMIGGAASTSLQAVVVDDVNDHFFGRFRNEGGGRVRLGSQLDGVATRDFGDAPDTSPGTASNNYRTLLSDNGPRHVINASIFLGASLDGESVAQANAAANGDDLNGALPDDEDGANNPLADLMLTPGGQPTVNVIVTNTTGSAATLSGWIDYNANGLFDNATERAQANVVNGANGDTVTLTFPVVPFGFTGRTYARFRLSTDAAAENPTGLAVDGEVEDYVVTIVNPSTASVAAEQKISDTAGNFTGVLDDIDVFGRSVAAIGDLNGDGVTELAVGADGDDDGGGARGAVWVLFMNANGTVQANQKISDTAGSFPGVLDNSDAFGYAVASLGDLDGDGISDIAVGAPNDDDGGSDRGAVWILFLNASGTVKSFQKISDTAGGFTGVLDDGDLFGRSVTAVGDLDGDGVTDLAVGAPFDDDGGTNRGAVWILFLNPNGTVHGSQKISDTQGTFSGTLIDSDNFGASLANLGDQNADGVTELAVGAPNDDDGGGNRGAVWILQLQDNGTVSGHQKISDTQGGFNGALDNADTFGSSLAPVGDLDGDGVTDLAVGAANDGDGGSSRGAVWMLTLNANGTVKTEQKISDTAGGFSGVLDDVDNFGSSVAALGDLNGDGIIDLAVGAMRDDDGGGVNRGAVWVLNLDLKQLAVTNTNDSGAGSLRQAILDANTAAGPDVITFDISGAGPHTITPLSALPTVTDQVLIDGTSEPDFNPVNANPVVEIDGSLAGPGKNGLTIVAGGAGSTIRGLAVNRFGGHGIVLSGSDGNTIAGNYVGADPTGSVDLGNGRHGVSISGGSGNTIGGTNSAAGNLISGNGNVGVSISSSSGNNVQANQIGTNAAGSGALPNKFGVLLFNSPGNTIGGVDAGNLISGNAQHGIVMNRASSTGNVVQGNRIGTNAAGTGSIGNVRHGVLTTGGAHGNTIGGVAPGEGNLISGNNLDGARFVSAGTDNNTVLGNMIGTDVSGLLANGNRSGVVITDGAANNTIGGTASGAGNVISANNNFGVVITRASSLNQVQGNLIGTDATGNGAQGNALSGVLIDDGSDSNTIGGTASGAGNVISGNTFDGVGITDSSNDNLVQGNLIGIAKSGAAGLGNNRHGVSIGDSTGNTIGGTASAAANVIGGNTNSGVSISGGSGNTVQGNRIGTNAAGDSAFPNKIGVQLFNAPGNTIGGTAAGAGNLISGNSDSGVVISGAAASGNSLQGNHIGTDGAGTAALGNVKHGVLITTSAVGNTIGGVVAGAGNVISGNILDGVKMTASGNSVLGNTIGTDASGLTAIANRNGVVIDVGASDNSVGDGTAAGSNTIAQNNQRGVWITSSAGTGNSVRRNSIHDNGGATNLGIDLGSSGVTANDAGDPDAGANNLQNFPVLTSAISAGGTTTIQGSLNSTGSSTFTVEFFSSPSADPSGFGEGQTFVGSTMVSTDPGGNVSFTPSFAISVPVGHVITATATDTGGNTSEFSAAVTVAAMLQAAGGEASGESRVESQELKLNQLLPIVDAAVTRLAALGLDANLLSTIDVSIADLPGAALGLAAAHSITLDVNAAGYGWFVDTTPFDDAEFSNQQSIDLLTAVMHELGHIAGLDDLDGADAESDLMYGWLEPGVRKTLLEASLADEVFADL